MSGGPRVNATGTVRPSGPTWFQYGTHLLVDDAGDVRCALDGDPVLLDGACDRRVRVSGHVVDGYPLDGGPVLLRVDGVSDA